MSIYDIEPFDPSRARTYPVGERRSKVSVENFALPVVAGSSFAEFLAGLPGILAADELRALAEAVVSAKKKRRNIIWGLGGHVIKVGLTPVLVELARRGFVSGLALNGSAAIHDLEVALIGRTSEEVEAELNAGRFGMAEETGRAFNEAVARGAARDIGMGEALGGYLVELRPRYAGYSLLCQAYNMRLPLTVHVTIGADIVHNHPTASGEAIGKTAFIDFRLMTALVAGLNDGGVYLNVGSAVVLPEVFLKCLALARNSGAAVKDFTTANLDFIQHYRPMQNVVARPVKAGGRGIAITGHHEIMVPLLAAAILEYEAKGRGENE